MASGRAFASLPSAVTGIPGLEYAVTSNGAAIYHIPTGKRCQEFPSDPSAVDQILGLVPISLAIEAFWEGRPYGGTDYVANPEAYGAAGSAAAYVKATRTPVPDIRAVPSGNTGHIWGCTGSDTEYTGRERYSVETAGGCNSRTLHYFFCTFTSGTVPDCGWKALRTGMAREKTWNPAE